MKNKTVAAMLALSAGILGMHYYYLGERDKGIRRLLFTIFLGWTTIPIWMTLADTIRLFSMKQIEFDRNYNGGRNSNIMELLNENRGYTAVRNAYSAQSQGATTIVNEAPKKTYNNTLPKF